MNQIMMVKNYKLVNDTITNEEADVIIRLEDNAYIPFDPANTDYQVYLAWVAAGGVPQEAD